MTACICSVIRNIEVIGEAAKRVSAESRSQLPGLDWKSICGTRDVLIHDYIGVDLDSLIKPEADKDIAAHRTIAIVTFDRIRQRIGGEVRADPGLYVTEQIDIARVANGVSADAEGAAVEDVQLLSDVRLIGE